MDDTLKFTGSEGYERLVGRWSTVVGDVFLDWLAAPSGMRWLDVGCGTGAFTEAIAARCAPAEVHGIDPSEAQIAYARSRDAAKCVQFRTGDALALPYRDASFDVATMALVISFVPDTAKATAEMARVVRPGGWVANYMWDIPGEGSPVTPLRNAAKALGLAPPLARQNVEVSRIENMRALWQAAGLEAVEMRRIDIEVRYAGFDDFWQSITAPGNPPAEYLRTLPPIDVERVRNWLQQSLPHDAAGLICYGAFANAAKGRVPLIR
jgi:ubiquinone/menaquinone biosynthesis C-methylase UbiE